MTKVVLVWRNPHLQTWRLEYYLGAVASRTLVDTSIRAATKGLAIARLKAKLSALGTSRGKTVTVTSCTKFG